MVNWARVASCAQQHWAKSRVKKRWPNREITTACVQVKRDWLDERIVAYKFPKLNVHTIRILMPSTKCPTAYSCTTSRGFIYPLEYLKLRFPASLYSQYTCPCVHLRALSHKFSHHCLDVKAYEIRTLCSSYKLNVRRDLDWKIF
ncbi:hypothetical protein PV325_005832 [Microctonus aethiopoides]|nr:hypothetical protein PV325_005832 [Microctonus aethiopoides]KAK0096625.1 hypothetical protein PV326_004952 [Microctonus aethiopoides]